MDEKEIMTNELEGLKKDIEKYQTIKSNLLSDIHSAEIQKENKDNVNTVGLLNKVHEREIAVKVREDKIQSRIEDVERKETSLKDRVRDLEKREQNYLDLEEKRAKLNEERSNFNIYKFNVERELEKARIIIEEASQKGSELKVKEESLRAREKGILKQEKSWNDRIGELEIERKKFEIETQNKEVVNV